MDRIDEYLDQLSEEEKNSLLIRLIRIAPDDLLDELIVLGIEMISKGVD